MSLSVVLPLPADAPPSDRLWSDWRALAAALAPGERIVAVVAGGTDALERFTTERGWGAAAIEILRVDETTGLADLEAAGLAECDGPALRLGPGDRIRPAGLARLRAALAGGADLVVANHMWHVTGPDAPLPCADAARWPAAMAAADPAAAATDLMADPARLVPYAVPDADAPEASYDARLAAARRVALVAEPVTLRAPDPDRLPALLARTPADIARHMRRLDDALEATEPAGAHLTLEAATAFLGRLPRATRRRAVSHDGPAGRLLAALARRDRGAAAAEIALAAAARDRAVSRAVAAQIASLTADLDLALPGPDYLRETYEWLRRP